MSSAARNSLSRRILVERSLGFLGNSFPFLRNVSTDESSGTSTKEWRKASLDQLERKFEPDPIKFINREMDLQPEWKAMESRVIKRRTLTLNQANGKTGRENIRQTEEDIWMENGLYDEDNKNLNENK